MGLEMELVIGATNIPRLRCFERADAYHHTQQNPLDKPISSPQRRKPENVWAAQRSVHYMCGPSHSMQTAALTKEQRALVRELEDICAEFNFDYHNISAYDPEARTVYLEAARDKIVRGQVIIWYTLVDEFLSCEMCRYYFGHKRSFPQLWRTKQFRVFNYHVIEELHLMQKLRHVRAFHPVPRDIVADIERLNALRNGLAHAFFPENLRKTQPKWKGQNIFSLAGLKALQADFEKMAEFFAGAF
ncbi:MAG: hypothetical protein WBW41_08370 [Verrucomicrobiia bacterium]